MNTLLIKQAADLICRTMATHRTPAGIAMALDAAGMLQSPEPAAELERLRARVAELEESDAPKACRCGHASYFHSLPSPRSCFSPSACDCASYQRKPVEGTLDRSPWQRAADGLNALVAAGIPVHVESDGHISNPCGDEHIEWDREAERWRLVHDDESTPLCRHVSPYGRACDYDKGHTGDHGMSDGAGGHFGWPAEEPQHAAPCRWPASPDCTCPSRPTAAESSDKLRGILAPSSPPEPNGCGICGIQQRPHGMQSTPGGGLHQWTAPTDEQIKARMQERRAIARAERGDRA
ncbi:hypothetical protein ACFW1M_11590 [Streptomyces inhibens]|uniref:hypothetical protein n=1 Tax=Streptomyces inhibens TaxID=2293571 RepID=UPI0036CD90BE